MVDRAKKISELPAATTLANSDFVVVVANNTGTANTKRITANNFRNSLLSSFTSNVATITTLTSSNVTANVIAVEDASFTGNVYLGVIGSNAEQLIHIHGTVHSNVVPHTPGNYDIGNATHYFDQLHIVAVHFADDTMQNTAFKWSSVPANSSANGVQGQIAYDSNYIYVCVTTNTWKRLSLGSY